ncbi:spore germination protein [Paenibacillus sp. VCA1]|uniref:spore germination protein n=1 Tax=Paenibacillus sp. VCA1 TaxID=3039148 RepID=UPI0028721122|nr:spore germination protein [Paenibacillus sp. VCA1]MDR9854350.1 spore germination protein [Paenibacillus sp. VCA1]
MSMRFRLKQKGKKGGGGEAKLPPELLPENRCGKAAESIDEQLDWFRSELSHCSDLVIHTFYACPEQKCALVFFHAMIDKNTVQEELLRDLLSLERHDALKFREQIFDFKRLPVTDLKVVCELPEGLSAILNGHVLLLVDGDKRMIEVLCSSFEKRSIEEAPNESVIRGPRESFIEDMDVNLTLLRRRLKTSFFKTESMEIGMQTKTKVVVCYMQGICKQELLDEVKRRLSGIQIDSVQGSSYLEEFIKDSPFSPFPQIQYTERPDVVSASLLEGRVAIIVDGTPIVLLAPVTIFMLMQAAEDYYQHYVAATWIRWIRYVFIVASLVLPSTYIAITSFHPEIIPSRLLISIAASREIVPFPALVEAFIMEIAFEALREATVRIPKAIGQSVSIIGALIIGQAAVQAGIVSSFMVIIVSLTGIASFISPHFDLGLAFRLLRFPIMILSGIFGLFGMACGLLFIYIHLINLRSFGTPYLSPLTPLKISDLKDIFIRVPWPFMNKRPAFSGANRIRQPHAAKEDEGD